ncbi:MAG: hypothetical protein HDS09_02125 [Bacteroides sp.]|nr:hypothetical protein [Bacteroides sp.]
MIRSIPIQFILLLLLGRCDKANKGVREDPQEILAETDSIAFYRGIVTSADEYENPECSLILKNKSTGMKSEILRTVYSDCHSWYIPDGTSFVEVPVDSIMALSNVFIWSEKPLQIIVEGCPDMRNKFSYFIDVSARKAWWIPANSGFIGGTEEGLMIFRSYRYVSDPEIGGRFTFLQIFNEDGDMVDSLSLEHIILSKYQDN